MVASGSVFKLFSEEKNYRRQSIRYWIDWKNFAAFNKFPHFHCICRFYTSYRFKVFFINNVHETCRFFSFSFTKNQPNFDNVDIFFIDFAR